MNPLWDAGIMLMHDRPYTWYLSSTNRYAGNIIAFVGKKENVSCTNESITLCPSSYDANSQFVNINNKFRPGK